MEPSRSLRFAFIALAYAILGGNRALAQGDSWTTIEPPMPTPRRLLAAAAEGGNLYVFGGCGSPCFGPPFHTSAEEETTVEVYSPQGGWSRKKNRMPTILFGAAAAAPNNGKIYTFGGYVSGNVVQEYDPKSDSWKIKRPMPTPRYGLAAVAYNGKVYVLGGSGPSGAMEVYDPRSDSWASEPPMPTPRVFLAAVAVDGKIYAIGGSPDCCGSSQTDVVEIYDPETRSWTPGAPLPIAQQVSAAVEANGKIYVFGGFIPGSGVQSNTFEYDPKSGEWRSRTPMTVGKDQAPAVLLGGAAYVPGGSVNCHCQALGRTDKYTIATPAVEITKDDSEDLVCPGDRLTYEIVVRSVGSIPISRAAVTDDPEGLEIASVRCASTAGSACEAGLSGDRLGSVSLLAGGHATFLVDAVVVAGAAGEVRNKACVEIPGGEVCSEADVDKVAADCVTISKADGADTVFSGEEVTYSIVVSNGSGAAVKATVTDEIDATGLIDFRWCLGDECESKNLDKVVSVPAGGSRTFTVTGTVPCGVETLTNEACVKVAGQPERCASDTDEVETEIRLRIAKTGPVSVHAGEPVAYGIEVFNDGECPVCGAELNDTAPPGLPFVPAEGPCGGGFPCALGCLDPKESTTVSATFQVPCEHSCPGVFTNSASVTSNGESAQDEIETRVECPVIDLSISKDDGQDFAAVLSDLTYKLKIQNHSQCPAIDALVTDKLPLELLAPQCIGENRSDCTFSSERDLSIQVDVPGHAEVTYEVQGKLGLECVAALYNEATVFDPEGSVDPEPVNNTDFDLTSVFPGPGVSVICSGPKVRSEGEAVTFTFVLLNGGPAAQADNPGDEFTDTLPAGLTLVSAAASSGTVTTLGNTVSWNGSIAACETVTITVEATVDAGTEGMTLCNPGTAFFDADGDGINESIALSGSCCVLIRPPVPIPAAGTLGLATLTLLLAALSLRWLRRPSAGR